MNTYFADLHVHVGRSGDGRPVKISAAAGLTLAAVLEECSRRKGIDIVAIVDCGSPGVQRDLEELLDGGVMEGQEGGGLKHRDGTVLIPAIELEIGQDGRGPAHYLGYFPDLDAVRRAAAGLTDRVTNVQLSTQRARLSAKDWLSMVEDAGGVFVPAHVFTPHRGFYGACARRLPDVFGAAAGRIRAVELGLSANTAMADRIDELAERTFVASSDAHSLPNIAREYTAFRLQAPTFAELLQALRRENGRRVAANYGLHPLLGKYHRSGCPKCRRIAEDPPPVFVCGHCGHPRLVTGVLDRLTAIADREEPQSPDHRPPYVHQVPLRFIPGVGPKTRQRLLERFGTEMDVLHKAEEDELVAVAGSTVAERIAASRAGRLAVRSGGGGVYGKVTDET